MRKKSHIHLGMYLNREIPALRKHKIALYIGCILPDLVPSFVYKRHQIDCTMSIVENEISKILGYTTADTYFCRHIGIITHYLSDYCTLPHNKEFNQSFKQHCKYEKTLKIRLKEYLQTKKCSPRYIDDSMEIAKVISKIHSNYIMNSKETYDNIKNIENDCKYILYLNMSIIKYIVDSLILEGAYATIVESRG